MGTYLGETTMADLLENKLRNAARRTATLFFLCNVTPENLGEALKAFEDALATSEDLTLGGNLQIDVEDVCLLNIFENYIVEDLYDMYHGLVNSFVEEALRDF